MIFKVKWGDLVREYSKKVMVTNPGVELPIKFYFEDNEKILTIIKTRGVYLYSELSKLEIPNLDGFKLEYLSDSFELLENPIPQKLVALSAQY